MPKPLNSTTLLENLKIRYYKLADQNKSLLELIAQNEVSEQVYNSNAIENSTLTLDETEKILLQVDLDRYVSERELFEARNLSRVTDYIIKKALVKPLDKETILLLHKMLISNIRDDIAGRFRIAEWVRVGNHIALDPKKIDTAIDNMLNEYFSSEDSIINKISKLHLTFEHIHPFVDGNGRIGRVIINYLLMRENYVPIIIQNSQKLDYYEAFKEFDQSGKITKMVNILYYNLNQSYFKRLSYLERMETISLKEYANLARTSYSNILNKAKRQTIEAFIERGIWKIGRVSSLDPVGFDQIIRKS